MKGLINIENNDNKCFLWCHIIPERVTKADKKMINNLDYKGIKFPMSKEDFSKVEMKNNV